MLNPAARTRRPAPAEVNWWSNLNVSWAVRLMLVGAALEIAAAVIAFRTESSLVAWFTAHSPGSSAALVHQLVVAQGQTQAIWFLMAAPCWLVMVFANSRAAGNGPRVISAVLLAIGLASLQSFGAPRSAVVVAMSVVICLVGTTTVMLLFSDKLPRLLRAAR
jgi:hypothetical protein